jgi:predicted nucleotidyltransferase
MMPSNRAPAKRTDRPHHLILSANHLAIVRELLQRHLPGVEVRAFGSRAGGNPKPASDLDLIAFSPEPIEPRQYALLADAFAESDLPFKVDVVDATSAPASFRARALTESFVVQPSVSQGA